MTSEELKEQARSAIKNEAFGKARAFVDQALVLAPNDITVHELDDYWYCCNEDMDEMACLRGRLQAIERMIELNPQDDESVYDEADYESGLYYEKGSVLFLVTEISKRALDLKASLNAYDKAGEVHGIDYWLASNRSAALSLMAKEIDAGEMQQVFGDVSKLQLQYMDALIAIDTLNPVENRAAKGVYLYELGRCEEAVKAFEYAIEADEKSYLNYLNLAECYLAMQQFENVTEVCAEVPSSYELGSKKLYFAAQALARLGKNDEALGKIREYFGDGMSVGVTGDILTNPNLVSLWGNQAFNDSIVNSSLNMEGVYGKRQKFLEQQS